MAATPTATDDTTADRHRPHDAPAPQIGETSPDDDPDPAGGVGENGEQGDPHGGEPPFGAQVLVEQL